VFGDDVVRAREACVGGDCFEFSCSVLLRISWPSRYGLASRSLAAECPGTSTSGGHQRPPTAEVSNFPFPILYRLDNPVKFPPSVWC